MKLQKMLIIVLSIFIAVWLNANTSNVEGKWHVVKAGETLLMIAEKYNSDAEFLAYVNRLPDWNWIRTGEPLWIPAAESPKFTTYIVQKNDILCIIAANWGVDLWHLARINEIYDLNMIYTGQRLIIPLE